LRGDLNVEQNKPTFFGKLVVKPGRKHRIIVEGTPYNLDGRKNLTETIVYRGQTFNVNETVVSNASLTYVFAGYQYDVLSREAGHLGIQVGGSYLDATGTISGLTSAISATKSQRIGLPLVGTEFRFAPIPGLRAIQIAGEVKGMGLGDYGHYIQSELKAGLRAGLFTFEAGYRFVDANVHETGSNPSGVSPQFKGPIAGVVFRY
jgi:hypothetical protein